MIEKFVIKQFESDYDRKIDPSICRIRIRKNNYVFIYSNFI